MGDTLSEYMHIFISAIIFTSAISFLVLYLNIMHNGSNEQIEEMKYRPSISMEGESSYRENDITVRGIEVFTDILGQKNNVRIEINGTEVNPTLIKNARLDDKNAVKSICSLIILDREYMPVTTYDENNDLVCINYVGR